MKDGFWSRIAGVNAQLYSVLALLFLLAAVFWALRPGHSGVIEIGSGTDDALRTRQTAPAPGPSVAAALRGISATADENPFSSEYLRRVNAQLSWAEQAAAARRAADAESAGGEPPAQEPVASEGEPSPEQVQVPPPARVLRLVYRGMITNLDGELRGLVENLESGTSRYYAVGAEIEWARIAAFARETMRIEADGAEHVLRRGLPFQIEEGAGDER